MMVGLVLQAYATNERSARGIQRHRRDDVAYRVITANFVIPDHATIARFLVRHERPLADLFASVLRLCAPVWTGGVVRSSRSTGRRCSRTPTANEMSMMTGSLEIPRGSQGD